MGRIRTAFCLAALLAIPFQPSLSADDGPIADALNRSERPAGDREDDVRRKPGEVLAFFGVGPGMAVLDLYSGGGYYAEIVSYVVGDSGSVVAHNNTPYLNYAKDDLAKRYGGGRLDRVERLTAENNEIDLAQERFDVILFVLGYHDIYYVDEKTGWEAVDGPALLAEVFQSLKPGGVLGVVDHIAADGSPSSSGQTLHRIDPALIRSELEAAGFTFEAESKTLRNPADDYSKPMFDPSIRGRTDRIVYRFRKPDQAE